MPAVKIQEFEVEGRGPFPVDMLRYDACWPVRENEDSFKGISLREPECYDGERVVRLRTIAPSLTEGRWRSFGWKIKTPLHAVD